MGMFDYLRCDAPLPETPVPPPTVEPFQTKDTPDQYMTLYTITEDGRLTWRPYEMVWVPKAERPNPDADGLLDIAGCMKRVEQGPEDIPYHGDIEFYTSNHPDVGWWEYRARFTEGLLTGITLVEFRAPEGRDVNAEIEAERTSRA